MEIVVRVMKGTQGTTAAREGGRLRALRSLTLIRSKRHWTDKDICQGEKSLGDAACKLG